MLQRREGEKVEDAYHRGLCLCGCIEILKEADGSKQQKRCLFLLPPWLLLLLISRRREIKPIVRNNYTTRGLLEKFSLPAAAELGLPTTVCTVKTSAVSWESVCTDCLSMCEWVFFFFCLLHSRWFDDVLVTLFASLVDDRGNE